MKSGSPGVDQEVDGPRFGEIARLYGRRWLNAIVRTPQRIRAAAAARRASRETPDLGVVVIVTQSATVRVCKLAYALKLCDYKVVLLHADPDFGALQSALPPLFDEAVMYKSPEDAVMKAASRRPLANHVFCNWRYAVAEAFVRMRPGVVVIDTKDVLGGFARPHVLRKYPFEAKAERFCFEHADGICCSDMRTQYLKRHLAYRLAPRLFWPDYCWPPGFNERRQKRETGKHVALVGSIGVDPAAPATFVYGLARRLAEAGIHYHVYPSNPPDGDTLRREIGRAVPAELQRYIHIHDTLSPIALIGELSKLHAGILISNMNVNSGRDGDTYFPVMGEYFLASRLFDYHEAGLLCLTQKMPIARHMFPRLETLREVNTIDELVEIVSNMEVRDIEIDRRIRIDHHAHRLREFYLRLHRESRARFWF